MASFIPIAGEVECLAPPHAVSAINQILHIPKLRTAQHRRDVNGGSWWFWKVGRDLKKRNFRAKQWYRANSPGREYVYFEGPVLYLSARETWTVLG